jgi:hypothetical protein
MVKNLDGHMITTEREQAKRWVEHFKSVPNRPELEITVNPATATSDLDINIDPPTEVRVRDTI